jgi:hypothetical protein
MPYTTSEARASAGVVAGGSDRTDDEAGGRRGTVDRLGVVEHQRQRPLEVRRRQPADVEHLEVLEGPFDVARQAQQLAGADPPAD